MSEDWIEVNDWKDLIQEAKSSYSSSSPKNGSGHEAHELFDTMVSEYDYNASSELFKLPTTGGYLLVTLNYPLTDKFQNMSSDKQKALFMLLWRRISGNPLNVQDSHYIYEYNQSGHIHLHGYIHYYDNLPLYPIGAVTDTAKAYHDECPKVKYKRYHVYNPRSLHTQYCRYRNGGICVQYLFKDDTKGIARWKEYMNKEQ